MIKALVQKAKAGETTAAKIVLERTPGPPVAADVLERLEALEQRIAQWKSMSGLPGLSNGQPR